MKRTISTIFILALFLSACGGSATATGTQEPSATEADVKTPEPQETVEAVTRLKVNEEALNGLEIKVWYPWYDVEASIFESLISDFNATNEWGIQVVGESQINFTNLYEGLPSALPTEKKPNVVIALPEHALEWNENRIVVDLTSYVNDPVYGIDSSDIPFAFWNQDLVGETRVAVPAQRTAQFLLWNETWAGELGFDEPPAVTEDFKQQACRAQQAMTKDESPQNDFKGGWYVDTESMTAYAWLLAFNGGVLEGNDYRFLTPNNIEAFKFLRELSESTCAWQAAESDPVTAFAAREALMITASLEDLPDVARAFASAGSRDTWKAVPFPSANDGLIVVYGSSYVMLSADEDEQVASWFFIRWLLEKEQDARFVEVTHLFPLRTSTMDLLGDYEKTHPQWAQVIDLLPKSEVQPQLASWRKVKVMLGDGFTHMYRVSIPSGQVAAILAQMESTSRDLSK